MDSSDLVQLLIIGAPVILALVAKLFKPSKPAPKKDMTADREWSQQDVDLEEDDDELYDAPEAVEPKMVSPMERFEQELKRILMEESKPVSAKPVSAEPMVVKPLVAEPMIVEPLVLTSKIVTKPLEVLKPMPTPDSISYNTMEQTVEPNCDIHGDAYHLEVKKDDGPGSNFGLGQAFDLRQALINQCILEPRHKTI